MSMLDVGLKIIFVRLLLNFTLTHELNLPVLGPGYSVQTIVGQYVVNALAPYVIRPSTTMMIIVLNMYNPVFFVRK